MRSCTPGFHNMAWSILTHCEFGIVYATLLRGPQRYLLLLTSDFGALPASELSFHCGGYLMAALRSFACTMGVACCANLRYSRNLRFTFHFHRWFMHDGFCLPCAPYCRHSRRRPHVFSGSKMYAFASFTTVPSPSHCNSSMSVVLFCSVKLDALGQLSFFALVRLVFWALRLLVLLFIAHCAFCGAVCGSCWSAQYALLACGSDLSEPIAMLCIFDFFNPSVRWHSAASNHLSANIIDPYR